MNRVLTCLAASAIMAGLALGSAGCEASGRGATGPTRPLPAYAGRAADLFDDTIEPAAVGLDFDKGYSPKSDATLRERAQVSDAVLRVRVSTVTAKKDGPDSVYELGMHSVERLAGAHTPGDDFTVHLTKTSESHGIMKNFETRLVGTPFIAFVREFVRPDGDREIHFHLAPDTKEVKNAVGEAVILGEVK
ncbi:MAG: cobalamin ABC transporter substrate-binding protein [Deltaproteobacteria bacterium]|nr:cobalamin ABC transporter substrate-binding protein [Deltaproteobacteria bacterium]